MIQNITEEELLKIYTYINDAVGNEKKLGFEWDKTAGYTSKNVSFSVNDNMELVNLVNSKTGFKASDITSLHYLIYDEGSSLIRHRDERILNIKNHRGGITVIFLLKMCNAGGEFYLDDIKTDLNKPGQYITFEGETTYHSVSEIKKGIREVLVVWYKPILKKTLL